MDAMSPEPSTIGGDRSVEELRRELAEAREQQTATAEILRVISSSPADLQRVFAEIAASAARLCDANDAAIHRVDGDFLAIVARHGPIPVPSTLPLKPGSFAGRAVLDQRTIHVADVQTATDEYPEGSDRAREFGVRTILAVPLIRAGKAIGTISIRRTEARSFTDRQVELLKIFADQAVIAIENTRLLNELRESLQQQTATADVLKVISRSALDLQRVLDALVESAARLCNAYDAVILQVFGDGQRLVAHHGQIPIAGLVGQLTIPLERGSISGHAVIDRRTIQVADILAEGDEYPEARKRALQLGWRTGLCVPLIHAGEAIGVILIRRAEVRPFTERQIELVNTFADQAVIAIENTRLFEAEQTRSRELTQALEQQTATADVLKVISRSALDLQKVLDALVESAARLCEAYDAVIYQVFGDGLRLVAHHGQIPTARTVGQLTLPLVRGLIAARAVIDRRTIQVADILTEADEYPESWKHALQSGFRTGLGVPLVHAGKAIGVIVIRRAEVRPFTERQIELVNTFADQAVIAIDNTRLFEEVQARTSELTEALEQQTATGEVLSVISSSPGELEPVFAAMLENAVRFCGASFGNLLLYDGERFRHVALHNAPQAWVAEQERDPVPPRDLARVLYSVPDTKRVVHISDLTAVNPNEPIATIAGARTLLIVPLLKQDELVGVIAVYRQEVRPFTDKQVELVSNFARQAVIAIENTRLLNELRESLQQQTATADVLKVISRATFDLPKVVDTLVESAASLCDSHDTGILQRDGDVLRIVSHCGNIPSIGPVGTATLPTRGTSVGRAVLDRKTIHLADAQSETDEYPEGSAIARRLGHHTILTVPLLGAGEAIGAIVLRRSEVRPFTHRQIELLQTFADQAVIAIENARLFAEVQSRTRELAKTVEDLEIASQHKSQFVANMSHELRTPLAAILGYAELIHEGFYEPQGPKSLDALTRIRSNGKHLLGLINTVLDIAKIESGQFTLNMAEYAMDSVVETVRVATEALAQNKKLALKADVAKSMPIGLGDEQRLTQVLLNLVGNAIKFTDTGEVRVTAKAINGHFAVSVADTGPGIPAEHQARIFEQFHQVDSSNTKAKGGTGLGLAIAKQIVGTAGASGSSRPWARAQHSRWSFPLAPNFGRAPYKEAEFWWSRIRKISQPCRGYSEC
jgi:GAF domain-containing protein/anti-sigma regulatory factor (Ser/Thr protein kinase)